jgi:hypothetical protein
MMRVCLTDLFPNLGGRASLRSVTYGFSNAVSIVFPVATHPGNQGTDAPQPLLARHLGEVVPAAGFML